MRADSAFFAMGVFGSLMINLHLNVKPNRGFREHICDGELDNRSISDIIARKIRRLNGI